MALGDNQPPDNLADAPDGWSTADRGNLERQMERGASMRRDDGDDEGLSAEEARRIAREAYEASTNWLNSSRRSQWADSLKAFQSKHPSGSKYMSRDYALRSNLFRPKTRSMVRNDEAQTASAFFSNEDVVSITPGDADDQFQKASADLIQEILQYRLTKTIPWFLTVVGARQDAEVQGVCVAQVGWKYEEQFSHTEHQHRLDENGLPVSDEVDVMRKVKDEPFIDLIAPENIRIEPGADWRDPINSSPYVIHLIPMYVEEVKDRIDSGEWNEVSESALHNSTNMSDDTTRRAREQGRVPGKDADAWKPRAFDICWVRRNIIRWKGEDWHFYSLGGGGELLTDPVPLREVEMHGERPYVIGYVVVETHKTYPASKIELVADLQRAANDDWNLRFDNLKLSLAPRQFVRSGAGFESQDLTRFAPGKVVIADIAKNEPLANAVMWDRPPPPDAAAYAEQDKINLDFDNLAGTFNTESVQGMPMRDAPATGMHILSGNANGLNEYELRVFGETFVEPILRLLVRCIQAYETDPVILGLAGAKANLFQKYGLNAITDDLLQQEVTTRVNVGIGATNPALKMQRAMGMAQAIGGIFGPIAAQKLSFDEVFKEFAALSGYKDGQRFVRPGPSVQEMQLMQQLQQLQSKQKAPPAGQMPDMSKVQAAQITAQGRVAEQTLQNQRDERSDAMDLQRTLLTEQSETQREQMRMVHDQNMAGAQHMIAAAKASMGGGAGQRQAEMAPPAHMLAEGKVRTFGNGQRWTMRQGKGMRV